MPVPDGEVALPVEVVALPEVLGRGGVVDAVPLVEPVPLTALLSWIWPDASRQCVAAEIAPLPLALGALVLGEVVDWPDAASRPPARNNDVSKVVLIAFIEVLHGVEPPTVLQCDSGAFVPCRRRRPSVDHSDGAQQNLIR
jgi:hypothetical protein